MISLLDDGLDFYKGDWVQHVALGVHRYCICHTGIRLGGHGFTLTVNPDLLNRAFSIFVIVVLTFTFSFTLQLNHAFVNPLSDHGTLRHTY